MESPPENDVCSVCHDNFSLPCQANCSHWFCGQCILRVWHHGSALQPCKCPICRRFITLLIPTEATQRQRRETEASQVLENIEKYNRLFGGGSNSLLQGDSRSQAWSCCYWFNLDTICIREHMRLCKKVKNYLPTNPLPLTWLVPAASKSRKQTSFTSFSSMFNL